MDNEKDYMDDMVASVFDGDKEEFYSAFNSEVGERIGEKLANKEMEIASDLLDTSEEEDQ
jgi:hypothetical protein